MTGQESLANYEVSGSSLTAIVDGFRNYPSVAVKYLEMHGIAKRNEELNPNSWYRLDSWILALEAMANEVGANSVYRIGKRVPENVVLPPHISDVRGALASIDTAYRMNHRKNGVMMFNPETGQKLDGIGSYGCELVPDANQVICKVVEVPYPCDLDRGLVGAIAARFEPLAKIQHDNDAPCRKRGGNSCTYVVFW